MNPLPHYHEIGRLKDSELWFAKQHGIMTVAPHWREAEEELKRIVETDEHKQTEMKL